MKDCISLGVLDDAELKLGHGYKAKVIMTKEQANEKDTGVRVLFTDKSGTVLGAFAPDLETGTADESVRCGKAAKAWRNFQTLEQLIFFAWSGNIAVIKDK